MQVRDVQYKALAEIVEHPLDLFSLMARRRSEGERCALATLVTVSGTFSRKPGAHMAICENGDYAGTISNGCVDMDIALQAMIAIESGKTKIIQYGEVAPYIDIKLPCGAGIKILVTPNPDIATIKKMVALLTERTPVKLSMNTDTGEVKISATQSFDCGWEQNVYHIVHAPKIQIAAAGRGQKLFYLTKLAISAGYDVICYSPDETLLEACIHLGAEGEQLRSIAVAFDLPADPWAATVFYCFMITNGSQRFLKRR